MGVSTLHASNIKGFALEFVRARPVWIGPKKALMLMPCCQDHFNLASCSLPELNTQNHIGISVDEYAYHIPNLYATLVHQGKGTEYPR